MLTDDANENLSRISLWQRVREFAVPPSMIDNATARRRAGDWAGACAAAGFDVDLDLRELARRYGRGLAARVGADLRYLAPDLLRWHMPRGAPDGLLRAGLTITLARYGPEGFENPFGTTGSVELVVRTAPEWADAGQRISLALWGESLAAAGTGLHPHPRPDRRFRLDLHRHLWDARRSDELLMRSGAVESAAGAVTGARPAAGRGDPRASGHVDPGILSWAERGCAVDRWADEARILLRSQGRAGGPLLVRPGARQRLVVEPAEHGDDPHLRVIDDFPAGELSGLPVLPDAATRTLPDLELLRAGAITADRLHPLVAAALVRDHVPRVRSGAVSVSEQARSVECRGERHRIGLRDGVLTALDHDPGEVRREELLAALTGTPLPCLQAIDRAHRQPDCLAGVRERLSHGDIDGVLAIVEDLLGPEAVLRPGALRDELEAAAERRVRYGMFRAGLSTPDPGIRRAPRPAGRDHPRLATIER
ncbi:hypothetical protein ABZ319_23270 [Nocardia sp. NPDC005978]|uniref:hypothetical protein n=1 Tax=Nocardia sp. NPDC005978 TaxID=3156725 RepID=UPI0033B46426